MARFDAWGRHPAAFSFPALELAMDAAVPAAADALVLDPFSGSGKGGTFALARGYRFTGIEAHPLIAELATLKLAAPPSSSQLRDEAKRFASLARARSRRVDLASEQPLLRRFVSAANLRQLVAYRQSLPEIGDRFVPYLTWALLAALRTSSGRTWPYAVERRAGTSPRQEVGAVIGQQVELMATDIAVAPRQPKATLVRGDARSAASWSDIASGSVSASVSSPPYLNQLSYAEVTRLELHFLGWASSWREMYEVAGKDLVASCTQQVTVRRAQAATGQLARLPALSMALDSLITRLRRAQAGRSRPKRYDLLLPSYFADLVDVLTNLHRVLASGARAAWVIGDSAPYGVYVDTPALLGLAASEIGFEVLDDLPLRERGRKWPGAGARHQRRLSERLLVFGRPDLAYQQVLPGLDWAPAADESSEQPLPA